MGQGQNLIVGVASLQDKNGNLWFSNWGGAYRYDGKTFTGFQQKMA
jgi:ligand-binding sensor domain-containing protein